MHTSRFVESYFDAWNHCDPKGVADHLAANGVYRDIPENSQRTHDELIASLTDFFSQHQHRYELIGDILCNQNTIAFQYKIHALETTLRDARMPTFNGAEFMTLNDDAAVEITDYYDVPGVELPSKLAPLADRQSQNNKYAKSGLTMEQLSVYKDRLERIMLDEQVYLQPELTLPRLADAVDCSVNHLSQVINAGFEVSFFDYLNQHRIAHAKALLGNLDDRNAAILNVAFTVGFNSNSAFYAAFKKCVGQTPAQYRRGENQESH